MERALQGLECGFHGAAGGRSDCNSAFPFCTKQTQPWLPLGSAPWLLLVQETQIECLCVPRGTGIPQMPWEGRAGCLMHPDRGCCPPASSPASSLTLLPQHGARAAACTAPPWTGRGGLGESAKQAGVYFCHAALLEESVRSQPSFPPCSYCDSGQQAAVGDHGGEARPRQAVRASLTLAAPAQCPAAHGK